MQKHISKKSRRLWRCGCETIGRGCRSPEQLIELVAIAAPRRVFGMLRIDEFSRVQLLHEMFIRLHFREEVNLRLIIHPGFVQELPVRHHIRGAGLRVQG